MPGILKQFDTAVDRSCKYSDKADSLAEKAHMELATYVADPVFMERLSSTDQKRLNHALARLSDAREALGDAYWALEKVAGR